MGEPDGLSSVSHALQVLLLLRQRRSLRVQEVAELLGLSRSTSHRLLAVLHGHGFLVQERSRGPYRAGPSLVQVGLAALGGADLRRAAQPILHALSEDLRETVSLILLDGSHVRFLESIEGPEDVRVSSRLGQSRPAHCTAGGKVLLAALDRDERLRLSGDARLLEAELEEVRARGYATNFEESTPGLHAVAVPVVGADSQIAAALAVSAPAARLPADRVPEIAAAASRAARQIERLLCVTAPD
jgi:DNA-binding IclR family transcriptional regulator